MPATEPGPGDIPGGMPAAGVSATSVSGDAPPAPPCVLAVAGSDSSGGAGLQADLKTMLALGVHGLTVVCAVTAQNSRGVTASWDLPPAAVTAQFRALTSDIPVRAVKTGMLATAANVAAVTAGLTELRAAAGPVPVQVPVPVVVDPVAVSSHGDPLLAEGALAVLRQRLLPLATVVTPNLAEARLLTGTRPADEAGMARAAAAIRELGPRWVLVKGGHLPGEPVDVLSDGERVWRFPGPRVASPHTHGTGCTLASAIASRLALGDDVPTAVRAAKEFTAAAIRSGFPLGTGTGPVGHRLRD